MFAYKIFSNYEWLIRVQWFGFGKLVINHIERPMIICNSQEKCFALDALMEFKRNKVEIFRNDGPVAALFCSFAEIMFQRDSLTYRTMMNTGGVAAAQNILLGVGQKG